MKQGNNFLKKMSCSRDQYEVIKHLNNLWRDKDKGNEEIIRLLQ